MKHIDTHVHLPLLQSGIDKVLALCQEHGIGTMLNVGYDLSSSMLSLDLCREHECIYASVGIHPHYVSDSQWEQFNTWLIKDQVMKEKKMLAIGEIGLDYVRSTVDRVVQQVFFRRQLQYALDVGLPVIIHNREADSDLVDILSDFQGLKGILHCYSSHEEVFLKKVLELGYFISFAGNLTYRANEKLRNIARKVPLNQLLLETDAPYLSPLPFRGKENHPIHVLAIYKLMSELKKISEIELLNEVNKNIKQLFNIEGTKG